MSYSTVQEFIDIGLRLEGCDDMRDLHLKGFLDSASTRIDMYLRTGGYDVPIPSTTNTLTLKRWEWILAKWDMLQTYGFDALARNSESIKSNYEEAMKELAEVGKGTLKPIPVDPETGEVEDADPDNDPSGFVVMSETLRGW